jgi:DNA replication and repair protein RecF
MYTSLSLRNFRSYDTKEIKLAAGVNIIEGPNATGKTNLLEALFVLNQGSSFRGKDKDLIKEGLEWLFIEGEIDGEKRKYTIRLEEERVKKELSRAGGVKKRMSAKTKRPTTLFEPEIMRMITGSPELRRTYLDNICSQIFPHHKNNLNQYKRAITQRNQLLKKQPHGWKDQVFVWNLKLSDFGAQIILKRLELLGEIEKKLEKTYKKISNEKAKVAISYDSKISTEGDIRSSLLQLMEASQERDAIIGQTSVGPHRDDINVFLNEKPANTSASRGEARTVVLALKIIELTTLEKETGIKPLLLLDDVFSELDETRRKALTATLQG